MGDELFKIFMLFLLGLGMTVAALLFRGGTPDELGCEAVISMNGWSRCEMVEHKIFAVGLQGCSDSDGHAYLVRGTNAAGNPASALVCCGTFLKSCTVRAR